MRIEILAIGAMKSGAEFDLCQIYIKRITTQGRQAGLRDISVREFAESRAKTDSLKRQDEATRIIDALGSGNHIVVLDKSGKRLTSEALAGELGQWLDGGLTKTSFIIGGPNGHGAAIMQRADAILSFGAMTWPHRLARVMLLEQLYRAVTILTNHPYHRQ